MKSIYSAEHYVSLHFVLARNKACPIPLYYRGTSKACPAHLGVLFLPFAKGETVKYNILRIEKSKVGLSPTFTL